MLPGDLSPARVARVRSITRPRHLPGPYRRSALPRSCQARWRAAAEQLPEGARYRGVKPPPSRQMEHQEGARS